MAKKRYVGPGGLTYPHLTGVIPDGAPVPGDTYDLTDDQALPADAWEPATKPKAEEK